MTERKISFNSGTLKIEGLLENAPGDRGVVVTHPHPLYGGDMYNNVVEAVCEVYSEKGFSSLRFNFRGTGGSGGSHEEGRGEQEDVQAAIDYLYDLGKRDIDLAGYSFGSWVNALALGRLTKVERIIMISPPVNMMDFSSLKLQTNIKLVIAGTEDEFGSPVKIRDSLKKWNPDAELKIIQGADHFYWGKTEELKSIIEEFLK